MSLKLVFSPVLNPAAVLMCKDYWSFANQGGLHYARQSFMQALQYIRALFIRDSASLPSLS